MFVRNYPIIIKTNVVIVRDNLFKKYPKIQEKIEALELEAL